MGLVKAYSAGGLVGNSSGRFVAITGCFWDTQMSGRPVGVGSGIQTGVTGKTTVQMQMQSTFVGWDFVNMWLISSNHYPRLIGFSFIPVPDVTGQTQAAAQAAITSAGFTLGNFTLGYHPSISAGNVISQSPLAGTSDAAGATVNLVISQGPSPYPGGSGTMTDPFKIATKADLLTLAATTEDYNKCFILVSDINLEGQIFTAAIIGPDTSSSNDYQGTAFSGTFDGNNHIISNFTIQGGNNIIYLGLFGFLIPGGSIKNLGLENYAIHGNGQSYFVGGLVGKNYGDIALCFTRGTVTNTSDGTGGLVGDSAGTISNCYSMTTVSSTGSLTGGLTGTNYYGGSITNCYSTGFAGGLVGFSNGGIVNGSFWEALVSGQTNGAGGIGKTKAEMQTLSTFTSAGWDFVGETANGTADIWFIREGQDYPRLLWENRDNQSGLYPVGFVTVNKTRVGRTTFEYELAVIVRNSNSFDMTNVQMQLKDWDAAVLSISDDTITIDTIPAGATVTSADTFKIVVDRSTLIVSSRLTWELTYYAAASGDQVQQAMMSMPLSALDAVGGDITGDGSVNLEDFAIMAGQWNTVPGTPSADIAIPRNNYVGIEDLIYLAENWMN
jgi:hypothetical protein